MAKRKRPEREQETPAEIAARWLAWAERGLPNPKGKRLARMQEILNVLKGLEEYWPLTVRGIFYRLGKKYDYRTVSRDNRDGRLVDLIPWEATEDRTRKFIKPDVYASRDELLEEAIGSLENYWRDLQQSQETVLEVWIEKDALLHIVQPVAFAYCLPVASARGFASVSYLKGLCKRIDTRHASGRGTLILYFGDMDSQGVSMPYIMENTVRRRIGIKGELTIKHCGLLPEHVQKFKLLPNLEHTKHKLFRETYGEKTYELDALHPKELQTLVRETIKANINKAAYKAEEGLEKDDRKWLANIATELRDKYLR